MAITLSEVYDALVEAGASHNSRLLRFEVMSALTLTLVVAIFVMVINLSARPG